MHLNVFTECAPSPQFEGLWRQPGDATATGYRSIGYWTALARQLEAACVDALFFADVHGVYDVYQGSWRPAVREAVQIPSIDPVLVIPAAAAVTSHLGFAVTYSTTYHPPYLCARTFSTLDHLTDGRIAWNIVTSYLASAEANGLGARLPHDERYDRADEYVDAVRALWERSWEDGAVVRDAERNVFTDPDRVHEADHEGTWFRVRGPHQCEPSPQRTPVLYQAGASGRGLEFAARHAEVVFMTLNDPKRGAVKVAELRERVAAAGRDRGSVKILQGMPVIVGRTRAEAQAKADLFVDLHSPQGRLAKWCGWMGVDLGSYPDDTPIDEIKVEGSRTPLDVIRRTDPTRAWVVSDIKRAVTMPHRPMRGGRMMLFGTVEEVADQMRRWMTVADVDGFNLVPCPPATGVSDICDLLIPELQRRGDFRTAYDPGQRTLRERYFGFPAPQPSGPTPHGAGVAA